MLSMAVGWFTAAATVLGGLCPLFVGRYLKRRDERKRACLRYWAAYENLMSQLRALQSAVNASSSPHKVPAEVRQRALDAERDWRHAANALLQVGKRSRLIAATTIHIQDTEQKIKAANVGEWPRDDGSADRRLHAAMRKEGLR